MARAIRVERREEEFMVRAEETDKIVGVVILGGILYYIYMWGAKRVLYNEFGSPSTMSLVDYCPNTILEVFESFELSDDEFSRERESHNILNGMKEKYKEDLNR